MTSKRKTFRERAEERKLLRWDQDTAEKILWAGCLDATEFMPAGSMYPRQFAGWVIPTRATIRRGCEWTWLDEECRVESRTVDFHTGWPMHGGQVFP